MAFQGLCRRRAELMERNLKLELPTEQLAEDYGTTLLVIEEAPALIAVCAGQRYNDFVRKKTLKELGLTRRREVAVVDALGEVLDKSGRKRARALLVSRQEMKDAERPVDGPTILDRDQYNKYIAGEDSAPSLSKPGSVSTEPVTL